jgi:glycosyltransferase involved in cell wall biosynthesis
VRICVYTETALPKLGGHEMAVDALARQYQRLGHDVVVLAPKPRRLRTRDSDFPYPVVRHPRFISTRRLVSWYRYFLLREFRRRPFDVLHCQGIYPPGYLAALTRDRIGVPVVITSQGGDVNEQNVRLRKPELRRRHAVALARADALVSIGRFTLEGFRRLCPEARRVVTIPNGADLDPFRAPAHQPADLDPAIRPGAYALFLGRLKDRKGVDVLISALAMVPATGGVQVVIAGDGEERPALEAQAARLGLTDRMRFVGPVFGATKVYLLQNARFTVMPTRSWEGLPLVACESLAAGTPVLGTRVPGVDDVVVPGKTGWLVEPESAPDLARVMGELLADPARTAALRPSARAAAEGYSWETIARRHLDLYAELIATGRAAVAA